MIDQTYKRIRRQRMEILRQVEDWLELPLVILGFVWLLLLVLELTDTRIAPLAPAGSVIWAIFIFDFLLKLTITPNKLRYLRRNWLTLIALAIPAFRIFRLFRALRALHFLRAAKGIRLLRVMTSLNRGMQALGAVLGRRGTGYVASLTILVTFAGAAGMYAFEREHGLKDYTSALWWTAMLVTTMGSEYWPQSPEGRILCLFLAIYAFAVFGYVTASLASYFVDKEMKPNVDSTPLSTLNAVQADLRAIQLELEKLRSELR